MSEVMALSQFCVNFFEYIFSCTCGFDENKLRRRKSSKSLLTDFFNDETVYDWWWWHKTKS